MAENGKSCSKCGKSPVKARGLCRAHYEEERKSGKPLAKPASNSPTPLGKAPVPKITAVPSPKTRKIVEKVGGAIAFVNGVAVAYVPAVREDALNPTEIGLLAIAAAEEIQSNKKLLEWYSKIGEGVTGPHAKMGAAVAFIALPRLARRGILPEDMVDAVLPLLFAAVMSDPTELLAKGEADEAASRDDATSTSSPVENIQPELMAISEVEEPEPVR
jgi:hypothetical protein